ncbi:MAG: P1 family peptidase, partial [Actinomycetota bacterium]|nr:P1 family peptidase [Actinomycetota bacterium]
GYPVGQPEPVARVPIVGAAIVLDAAVAVPHARPGAAAGRAACEQATSADPPEGGVGVGAGCMVAKVGGLAHAWRGGQGIAVRRAGDVVVGALVANNAVGEVHDEDGTPVATSRAPHGTPRYPYDADAIAGQRADAGGPTGSTVIGCVVTNARLVKSEACRVADLAHSGIARAVRPAHTQLDGDALFCLATGEVDATVDLLATLAAEAVADACRRGVRAAVSRHGVPGLAG